MNLQNLLTDSDIKTLHELRDLTPRIKSKYFSLGRDIDTFLKLIEKIGKPEAPCNPPSKE